MVNEKLRKQLSEAKSSLETQISSPSIENLKQFHSQPKRIQSGWMRALNATTEHTFKTTTRQYFAENGIICSNFALDEMWLEYQKAKKAMDKHFPGLE